MAVGKRRLVRLGVIGGAVAALCSGAPLAYGASSGTGTGASASASPAGAQSVLYGRRLSGRTATFHLTPASLPPLPANMPDTVVTVQLPLFARAFPSLRPFPLAYQASPQTPYLVVAGSNYVLMAPLAFAEKWYSRHLADAGYVLTGEATVGDFKTGQSSDAFTYTSKKHQGLAIDVSFQSVNRRRTLLRYWVKDILAPPRPPASLLPENATGIQVQYIPATGKTPVTVTITNPQSIRAWVQQINALPIDTRSLQCSAGDGESAQVSFMDASGQASVVKVDPACGQVILQGYPPLQDKAIWKMVLQAVHKS